MSARELGKVEHARLYIEDHGILTVSVGIDFGGSFQSFGGYALDERGPDDRRGTAAGCDFVLRLLRCFGASSLDELKGRTVYAIRNSDALNAPIVGLEMPPFDGGRKFLISDWHEAWGLGRRS